MRHLILTAGLLALPLATARAQDGVFRYTEIPTVTGSGGLAVSRAEAPRYLNDNGVVVGQVVPTGTGASGAFYSVNGAAPVVIPNFSSGGQLRAQAVSNSNLIVGEELVGAAANGFYFKLGVSGASGLLSPPPSNTGNSNGTGLPDAISGYTLGVNDAGRVVGRVASPGNLRGFQWLPQGANALPTAAAVAVGPVAGSGPNTGLLAVNNGNLAVGLGQDGSNSRQASYGLGAGTATFLQWGGLGQGRATSVTDAGVIVGEERATAGGPSGAYFLSAAAARVPIPGIGGTLPGTAGYGTGGDPSVANFADSNLVVFNHTAGGSANRAAIFTSLTPGTAFDLNLLANTGFAVPAGVLEHAVVNRHGQVAAAADTVGGSAENRVYLGTPELNWRGGLPGGSGAGGNWTDANAWGWGVRPASMHPVFVNRDSAGLMAVTLAAAGTAVAELNVGTAGAGDVTFTVADTTLTVTNNAGTPFGDYSRWASGQVTVGPRGTLVLSGATLNADQGLRLVNRLTSTPSAATSVINSSLGVLNLANGQRIIRVEDGPAAVDLRINAPITGGGVSKDGSGTLLLTAANTYTGLTFVGGGAVVVNGSLADSTVDLRSSGTLAGTGTLAGPVGVEGTVSPGDLTGTVVGRLGLGATNFEGGGNYNWQVADAAGAAGTGFDRLNVTGTLNVSANAANPFRINLWSLSDPNGTNGPTTNFDPAVARDFVLVQTTGGITNFSPADFLINTAAVNGTGGFQNFTGGGVFEVSVQGNDLVLRYTPVPEPAGVLAACLATAFALRRLRNRFPDDRLLIAD